MNSAAFSEILIRNPKFIKKKNEMAQVADLVLYPLVKGKYDDRYRPYQYLVKCGKIVDARLDEKTPNCGVKYSCFDDPRFL